MAFRGPFCVIRHLCVGFELKLKQKLPRLKSVGRLKPYLRRVIMWPTKAYIAASADLVPALTTLGFTNDGRSNAFPLKCRRCARAKAQA